MRNLQLLSTQEPEASKRTCEEIIASMEKFIRNMLKIPWVYDANNLSELNKLHWSILDGTYNTVDGNDFTEDDTVSC